MSQCQHYSTYAEEVWDECKAKVKKHMAIHVYHTRHLPFSNIDLLDPPLLMFPHREALYKNVQSMGSALQGEDGRVCEFAGAPNPESPDEAIEVGDRIYATMLHPPPIEAEIQASQTTSQ